MHLKTAEEAEELIAMLSVRAAEHTGLPVSEKVAAGVLLALIDVNEEAEAANLGTDDPGRTPDDGVDDVEEGQDFSEKTSVDALSERLAQVVTDVAELKERLTSHAKLVSSDVRQLDDRLSLLETKIEKGGVVRWTES
jgi:hypothetical protein